ncbi:MAG: GspH/FimT family pseudopilin [Stenotrophobium sp.]
MNFSCTSIGQGRLCTRTHDGFTLLEMMVTVTIAGVLAAIAIPSFTTTVRNNRMAAVTNELTTALTLARTEAIKRSTQVIVCRSANATAATPTCVPSGGGGWEVGWVVYADVDNSGSFNTGDLVINRHDAIPGGITITGSNNVVNRVIFRPQGIVTQGSFGSFDFEDGRPAPDGSQLLCLPVTGRARLAVPASDGTLSCT